MGLFTKDIETLQDLYVHQLQDVYYAEQQIAKALPKMAAKATNPQLRAGFELHLRETEGQIARLEQVFKLEGLTPKGVTCPAIDGIIKEANEVAGDVADKAVLDAGLIASAQAVEHYEIARYGTLIAWRASLGAPTARHYLRKRWPKNEPLTRSSLRLPKRASTSRPNWPETHQANVLYIGLQERNYAESSISRVRHPRRS